MAVYLGGDKFLGVTLCLPGVQNGILPVHPYL